ncbi:MAG: Alpha-galactosidase, partial [uncultured Thermomicrobiales bacterium]
RPGAGGAGGADGRARARLSRDHARPADERRADAGRDPGDDRRAVRRPRGAPRASIRCGHGGHRL